jgi:hypothetical protein
MPIDAAWKTLAAARHLAAQSESQRRIRMVDAVAAELQLRQGQVAETALADWPAGAEAQTDGIA